MDEQLVVDRLRTVVMVEPPLGFDPDEVATMLRGRGRRRAMLATGLGTMVLVGVVTASIAVSGAGSAPEQHDVAAPAPTTSKEQKTRKPRPSVAPPGVDLTKQGAELRKHLLTVLPTLVPDAVDVDAKPAVQKPWENSLWDQLTVPISYRDSLGAAGFNLTVHGPVNSTQVDPLDEQCEDVVDPRRPSALGRALQPTGPPQRCDKIKQPDGSTVVLEGDSSPGDRATALHAAHYRNDGTVVSVWNIGANRSTPPLSEDRVIKLVTDPAFTLK